MGRRRAQLLLPIFKTAIATRGGEAAKGRRKVARPISLNRPMHLCLRASSARGEKSLRHSKNYRRVSSIVREESAKHSVRLEQWANVGNHLHFMLRVRRRENFRNFLRSLAGRISMAATGARKGDPLQQRFWDALAYSRMLTSRPEEEILRSYIGANEIEAHSSLFREVYLADEAERRRNRRREGCNGYH